MATTLTDTQKAAIADCACPLPKGLHRERLSAKAIVIPFVVFGVAVLVLWAVWPQGAVWLLGIYGALVLLTGIYRLIRGHTLWCVIKWSPVAALYVIGDGIASATP